jgi:hypothetical protein
MLCELSKEFEAMILSRIKNDLTTEITRLDALAFVYHDRDRVRYDEIMEAKRNLEMKLLEVM